MRAQQPGELIVHSAHLVDAVDGATLELGIDCRLSGPMRDALDRGIPLTLIVSLNVEAVIGTTEQSASPPRSAHHRIEMRYFPLSRRYLLRDADSGRVLRSVAASAYLFDALNALRLPLGAGFAGLPKPARLHVDIGLDRVALPGALRLPSMFEPAWHLRAPEFAWTDSAG